MHGGMQYDAIQGQGHEPLKVGNPSIFKAVFCAIYNGSWQLTIDSWTMAINMIGLDFLYLSLVFVSRDSEIGINISCENPMKSFIRLTQKL